MKLKLKINLWIENVRIFDDSENRIKFFNSNTNLVQKTTSNCPKHDKI